MPALNSGYIYRHRAGHDAAGVDIVAYHALHFRQRTAPEWRDVIAGGLVHVNGRVADVDQRLRDGDEIEFHRPPWIEPDAPAHFGVVYEDDHVLVVEKPSGLQVLPAGPFNDRTLLWLVRASAPHRAESSPVHRLGRGTSGLVLFGLTSFARSELSMQFEARTPTKTYLALVEGTSLPDSCLARQPIGKVPHGPMSLYVAREGGKPSLTRLRVLARDAARDRSLVAAQPVTGRPDQIRIHVAACGAPLVGDPLFGPGGVAKSDVPPGTGGYFLHAAALRVAHPATGRPIKFRSRPAWLGS